MSFTLIPHLAPALLAALAAAALALTALAALRRAPWLLRATAFALLLGWLAGPTLVRETGRPLPDIALLLLDQTPSMAIGHRTPLAAQAAAAIAAQARRLPGLELRTATVPPGHAGTRLWQAATEALADIPRDRLAGVVAITDGEIHDTPPPLPPGVPVHALIAARGEEWERRLRLLDAPGYGIVGGRVTLRAVVEDQGPGAPGGTATVTIRHDAETDTRAIQVGEPFTIDVPIAHPGETLVALLTPALPGEPSTSPHTAAATIHGVRDRLRVLLVSGEPTQDERTWRRLLKSDPAVDLVHFTILRPPEKDDTTPLNELALIAFPTRELFAQKLGNFDLVILDRFADRGILPHLYLRNIADYVRRGGALMVVAGPEFAGQSSLDQTPLADVLPAHAPLSGEGVATGAFRPRVTALGARHPVAAALPGANPTPADQAAWGPWYRQIASEDVRGQVLLAGHQGAPLLILNREGQGRIALLLSDQGWLWSRGHDGGGPEAELLRRVAHWLMAEPELEEERLAATAAAGQLHIERHTLADHPAAAVAVTAPDGSTHQAALAAAGPGAAAVTLPATAEGIWKVTDGPLTALAAVGPDDPIEAADRRATATRLAPTVAATGGGTIWLGATGPPTLRRTTGAGATWIGLPPRHARQILGVATTPLLPAWLALTLLLTAIAAAWWRESQ